MFTVGFTGHRPELLGGYAEDNPVKRSLQEALSLRLGRLREGYRGDLRCISGMALGFDQWAAEVCADMAIPFVAAVPFVGQASRWPAEAKNRYLHLLGLATTVHVCWDGPYNDTVMQVRNEWVVDNCDLLIAAFTGAPGGTANTILYANRAEKPVELLVW